MGAREMTIEAALLTAIGALVSVILALARVIVVMWKQSNQERKEMNDVTRAVEIPLTKLVTLIERL